MKNTEENTGNSNDYKKLFDEYKLLREEKNHHDTLIWQIIYFYFAIAPLFLLVGGTLEKDHPGALLASIIFDFGLGLFTVFALLNHRGFWNYAITRAKEIEKPEQNFGMKHFLEYKNRHEEIGLGLKISSMFLWAIICILLFLATLVSIGVSLFFLEEINSKITILVFIFVFSLLIFLCFAPEFNRRWWRK